MGKCWLHTWVGFKLEPFSFRKQAPSWLLIAPGPAHEPGSRLSLRECCQNCYGAGTVFFLNCGTFAGSDFGIYRGVPRIPSSFWLIRLDNIKADTTSTEQTRERTPKMLRIIINMLIFLPIKPLRSINEISKSMLIVYVWRPSHVSSTNGLGMA